jgi:uncharacterized RDD family membrane protein YckC
LRPIHIIVQENPLLKFRPVYFLIRERISFLAEIICMDPYNYSSTTETTDLFPQTPVTYGTFWERFLAAFIDGLILAIPNIIIDVFISGYESSLITIVIGWIYYASMESGQKQATLGKQAMGLKVTDLSGGRISFGQATIRHFGKFVSAIILCIGYLMMLWDSRKQTLHDKIASTLVIKNKTSW